MIGTVLKHRYVVQEKIGDDSLFSIYKCDDKINNSTVAIKVLLPQHSANTAFGDRVLSEAQAMVGVSHPGIVEVYDSGFENGMYFVVVEYVRGVDLSERIRRSAPFTLSTVVEMGSALCDVLDYAHSRGFVHGDLRPGNILVSPAGQIKIDDFWVAGAVAASQTVRSNAMMQSVRYMSPEVAEGKVPTPGSDIYSLGIILFELLSGKVPYDGDTAISIAMKHAREPVPSIRYVNPGVPRNLEIVIGKAMQKAPENRFRSAKAMRAELKSVNEALHLSKPLVWSQVTDQKPVSTAPLDADEDSTGRMSPALKSVIIVLVAIIVLGLGGLGAFILTKPKDIVLPNLVGRTFQDAENEISRMNMDISVQMEEYNERYPAGVIYYMSPESGRAVRKGEHIRVWVSKGSRYALVPHLVGSTLEEARQRLSDAGLALGDVDEDYSTKIAAGSIMKQSPEAGKKIERNEKVSLTYSLGPKSTDSYSGLGADSDSGTYSDTGSDTSSDTGSDGSNAGKTRSFDVAVDVPPGRRDVKVEIRVADENGERAVYSRYRHPGDHVEQTVTGVGDVTIKVYVDDKLVEEERK